MFDSSVIHPVWCIRAQKFLFSLVKIYYETHLLGVISFWAVFGISTWKKELFNYLLCFFASRCLLSDRVRMGIFIRFVSTVKQPLSLRVYNFHNAKNGPPEKLYATKVTMLN